MAENGPFGTPFLTPKIPPKKVYVSQEIRHINFFLGAQNWGFWVGAKKFMLKKFMCFFRPSNFSSDERKGVAGEEEGRGGRRLSGGQLALNPMAICLPSVAMHQFTMNHHFSLKLRSSEKLEKVVAVSSTNDPSEKAG